MIEYGSSEHGSAQEGNAGEAFRAFRSIDLSRKLAFSTCLVGVIFVTSCLSRPGETTPPIDPSSLRTTQQGELIGFQSEEGSQVWRGIPFARPPVGPLRWRAPQPPQPWQGTLEALSYGPSCVQFASQGGGRDGAKAGAPTGSEDCLYLNVYAPRFETESVPRGADRLPVMVWIHGGGNTIGDATVYDGSLLAVREKLIIVTVQHRLGVFGWFAHPALRGEDTSLDDRSGNYGTLDLVRALEWVQTNISDFGGDPQRVTVFGESAGGSNTYTMILSPRASGLFQRAIVQSGRPQTVELEKAENYVDDPVPGDPFSSGEVVLELLIRDGRARDRASAKQVLSTMSATDLAAYLRGKSATEILSLYEAIGLGGMYDVPTRFRDGRVLPAVGPLLAFERGEYNRVPAILGTNRDENKLFMLFESEYVTRVFGLPVWINNEYLFAAGAEYRAKAWKARGVDAPATRMRKVQGGSVFAYRFDWDEEPKILTLDLASALGAAHGLEIPFVFGWMTLGPATKLVFSKDRHDANLALSRNMMSYWSEFAYTGDPSRGREDRLPLWSSWSADGKTGDTFLILDTKDDGGVRMSRGMLTMEAVLDAIANDSRFTNARERCEVYAGLVRMGTMDVKQFNEIEGGVCPGFSFDAS